MSGPSAKPVRWLSAALADLEQITDLISTDNPGAADKLAEEILAKTRFIGKFPEIGSRVFTRGRARSIAHGRYLVYYTVDRHEVVIRAVVHGARQFQPSWLKRHD